MKPPVKPPPAWNDPRSQAAAAVAAVTLVLWAIRAVTHTEAPAPLAGVVETVVPAAVAWLFAHLAWKATPPS